MQEGNEFACFDLDGFSTSAGGVNVERGCGPDGAGGLFHGGELVTAQLHRHDVDTSPTVIGRIRPAP